jgi:xanthine dehydrogenase molybdenum-binding subunit
VSGDGKSVGAIAKPVAAFSVIGSRPVREDAYEKVTGQAIFGTDVRLPGQVPGKVLRSPHAHARIRSIDTSRAEALPGVLAVVTARDIWAVDGAVDRQDEVPVSLKFFRDHCMASDKALFKGHAVAAVAAIDQYVADEACALIRVEYDVLPPVMDVLAAREEHSPLLHERLLTRSLGQPTGKASNVAEHFQLLKGDPERGLAEADVVVEREYRTATVHQGYIEPHVCVASWAPDGNLTVWTTTQGHFGVRDDLVRLLQAPVSRVRVVPAEIGGGFGGKQVNYLEPIAALLSRKACRPVRLIMSRAEVFEASGPTPGCYMKVKMGATRDGQLTAVVAELVFEAGAYPGSAVGAAARCMTAAYDIPNARIDGYDVVLNKPRSSAYRAPGVTQSTFAGESVLDELAEKLVMDPLELRLKNAAREGTQEIGGTVFARVGIIETMEAAKVHPHFTAPLGGPNRGRGIACGWWPNFGGPSSCSIGVNSDGTVNLISGSVDLQGTRTTIAMQAAETLGIPIGSVHPTVGDTDSIGQTGGSGGSRVTYATGLAAIEAAQEVLRQMGEHAARLMEVETSSVTYCDGVFTTSADPEKRMTFAEVAAKLNSAGGPVFGSAAVSPRRAGSALGAHIVDVEVDPETGQVRVLRYTAVQDAGKAVHPGLVEGQIQGGVAQGIGWALWEGYRFDEKGRMGNRTFLDYKLPTSLDLPMLDTVIVEVPNPGHPYGVRGVGETPITVPPAAIANAIHSATGVRLTELPMTPDRILTELGVIE